MTVLYSGQTSAHSKAENMPLVHKDPSAKWADLTNVPQATWEQQHLEGLPAGTFLEIDLHARGAFNLRFRRPSQDGAGDDISFHYGTQGHTLHLWSAGVTFPGGNIAATVSRNILKVAEEFGIRAVSVQAGKTVGPYLWARAGFKPDAREWRQTLRHSIGRRVKTVQSKEQAVISQELVAVIQTALNSNDPRALWTIVDIRNRIGPNTLGAFLTVGLPWNGICDLSDPHCAARFKAFAHQKPIPAWTPPDTPKKNGHALRPGLKT